MISLCCDYDGCAEPFRRAALFDVLETTLLKALTVTPTSSPTGQKGTKKKGDATRTLHCFGQMARSFCSHQRLPRSPSVVLMSFGTTTSSSKRTKQRHKICTGWEFTCLLHDMEVTYKRATYYNYFMRGATSFEGGVVHSSCRHLHHIDLRLEKKPFVSLE